MDFNENFVRDNYYEMYWVQKLSLPQISKKLGIPYSTLRKDFERLGIRVRNYKQAVKLDWKRKLKLKRDLMK